jgi:hypothetical protein
MLGGYCKTELRSLALVLTRFTVDSCSCLLNHFVMFDGELIFQRMFVWQRLRIYFYGEVFVC